MTPLTKDAVIDLIQRALAGLDELPARVREELLESEGWTLILYQPHPLLSTRLTEYFDWRAGNRDEKPGPLMEEIALLLFQGLKGTASFRSFQSYAPQHDLVVDGSSPAWQTLMQYLHLERDGRSIVIEAKNQEDAISDQQFSRLCYMIQNKFEDTADLGVFVSRTNASGFPGSRASTTVRARSLQDVGATQALFHAKTGKYVVVLDEDDLKTMLGGVPLPKLLEAKIREVEAASGLAVSFSDDWRQVDLPPYLRKYMKLI